jgi:hypothetical protein
LSAAIVEELEPVWVCCGWRPKHVEQLSDKMNSVTCLSSWNYILENCMFTLLYKFNYDIFGYIIHKVEHRCDWRPFPRTLCVFFTNGCLS